MAGDNSEVVRVGQSDHRFSRRDFLKAAVGGLGAMTLSQFLTACGVKEGSLEVDFKEVLDGQSVNLILPGEINPTPVVVEYPKHGIDFTPLQMRQDANKHDTFQPFTDGATTTRKMGELTSQQIFRVTTNPVLDGIAIHTYPSAVTEMGAAGQSALPPNQEYFALKVITRLSDYLGDHKPEVEYNGHQWGSNPVTEFGVGAYVATLEKINGKMTLHGGRFVQDWRAFVPAPAK